MNENPAPEQPCIYVPQCFSTFQEMAHELGEIAGHTKNISDGQTEFRREVLELIDAQNTRLRLVEQEIAEFRGGVAVVEKGVRTLWGPLIKLAGVASAGGGVGAILNHWFGK